MKNVKISFHEAFLHSKNDALKEMVCVLAPRHRPASPQETSKASIEAGMGMVFYGMIGLGPIYCGIEYFDTV